MSSNLNLSATRIRQLVSSFLGANVVDKPSIVRGVFLSYIQMAVGMLLTFLLTPITIYYLGATNFGLWVTLGSVVGYFGLTDFGMTAAVLKYTAEYRAQDNHEALNRVLSTILGAFILIGLIIFLLALLFVPLIPRLFQLSGDLAAAGQIAFLVMVLNVALGLISGVFTFVIYGYQRVDVQRAIAILSALANAGLVVLSLKLGGGLIGVALASTFSILSGIILAWAYVRISKWGLAFSPRRFDLQTLHAVAPYSLRCFILGVTNQILFRTDNIVIAMILGMAAVTPYAVVFKLTYLAKSIVSQLSDTIQPTFTRLYTIGDQKGLKDLYFKSLKLSVGVMVLLAIFLLILGQPFINLWVGAQNFAGMDILVLLVLIDLIFALNPNYTLLQAIGKNQALTRSSVLNAALNLFLSIYFARRIGLVGVPLGTLIAHLCTDTWVVVWSVCKNLSLPGRIIFVKGILPPFFAGVPAAAISYYLLRNLSSETFLAIGLKGAFILVTYSCAIGAIWILSKRIKNTDTMDPHSDEDLSLFRLPRPSVGSYHIGGQQDE